MLAPWFRSVLAALALTLLAGERGEVSLERAGALVEQRINKNQDPPDSERFHSQNRKPLTSVSCCWHTQPHPTASSQGQL